jgi:hypothetical protein
MDDNTEYKKMKETLDEVIKILYFYRPQDTMIDESSFDGSIEAMDTIEAVIDRYMAPTD